MKNRRITTNVRTLFELIKYSSDKQIEAIILSLDFMKCFDRIEFKTILKSLEFFGFDEYVVEWTKILYNNFRACTQNNGHFSKIFSVTQGLHQGGPCSSVYFLICAEVMAIMLRNNENIEGITINDILNLLGQYADDADLYLLHKQSNLDNVFIALETFRTMSGFALNYDKTSILRIGSLKDSESVLTTQRSVSWTNEPINVLGIWVSPDLDVCINKNYTEIVTKAVAVLKQWKNKTLSLIGKILVVNTLIMSLFVYRMTALPFMMKSLEKQLKQEIISFIWNGARPKISYETLTQRKENGGMGLIDIGRKNKALKISWIQILSQENKLSNMVYENNVPHLKELIWECNLSPSDIELIIDDPFWAEVLKAWNELKIKEEQQQSGKKIVIWLNSNIVIRGKPVFWKHTFQRGLINVNQLYANGQVKSALKIY